MAVTVKTWVIDTALRAVKTAAQSAIATLTVGALGVSHVDWVVVGDVAGLAAVLCVLHNLSTLSVPGDPEPVPAPSVGPAAPVSVA